MENKKIKFLIILLSITIIIILSTLIYFLQLQESRENTVNVESIENDISYIQGPLNQNIENLEYNSIEYIHVTDKQIAQKYFENYIQMMIDNSKQAYTVLEKEYQNKRFDTYEIYNKYIQENISYLEQAKLESISIKEYDNYKKYICKDQYRNVYVFKEIAVMDYTVQLDDYTLENDTFNEKYKEVSYRDKGLLNVDKFFKMINMQDYKSAYTVLDANFKQNYFKTQADFENYMKNKVFRYNKVEYKEYSNKVTDIYTYKVVLTDMTEEKQGEVEFNIVMKLLEGTEFVMSFQMN